MSQSILSFLNQIEWIEGGNQIPRWHDQGIRHGFEGLGHELPPFGIHLKQIHSRDIHEVNEPHVEGLVGQGDALATSLNSQRIAVKTADCVPVLIHHPEMAMAIHAGWRGLAQDILGHAAEFLQTKGSYLSQCEWAIGPAISASSFEIGPEVLEHFQKHEVYQNDLSWSVYKGVKDRWHLDLQQLAAIRLMRIGVAPEKISVLRVDTKTGIDHWHSYRRSGQEAGRNWTWIELGSPSLSGQ